GVVFNGAIYNFRELRADLERRGCTFKSHTDTEVPIHGYREWGIDNLVARLKGMFAFGLWDDETRRLFLVRDRLGVKPLLYAARGNRIAFASTARALRRAGFAGEIDEQAITEYLEFGYVTDDLSIYEGVSKVPAATIVEWSSGTLTAREYWSPPEARDSRDAPTFEEAIEETERLFVEAVEKRLFADVPVGALLSGGVDSSLVCWAISKLGGDITAYTVGVPGDSWDETTDARHTADALKIKHQVLELSPDDAPDMTEFTSAYGEPFACASGLGMLQVSRAVASEATVLLTGDGGDDVFLGYPEHRHLWLAERLARRLPGASAQMWNALSGIVPRVGPARRVASFLNYTTGGLGAVACAHDGLPAYARNGLLGERLTNASVRQRAIPWSLSSGRQVLTDFLKYDRRTRFVGEYMTKVDGATMRHALEARSPFLDQDLWAFAASLPFDVRLRGNELKAVLRELARRKVGERVAEGKKRGFGVPVQRWLVGRWRASVEESLRDALVERHGWIRSSSALDLLEQGAREKWAPKSLWYVFVLESWLRYEQGEAASEGIETSGGVTVSSSSREPAREEEADVFTESVS
ncbi:MAG: asparagine synthase (glutamine-hydrolyzing), partial [Acidobacteriota bacterium]|nr:asparagine synthase (glutamine-hydrolyzing) [Acidobacteriota bacterium]